MRAVNYVSQRFTLSLYRLIISVLHPSYTQSQKKRHFSSWIFSGAQHRIWHYAEYKGFPIHMHCYSKILCCYGHLTLDHGNSACITLDSLVYTLLQKKGNFQNVAFLLRESVEHILLDDTLCSDKCKIVHITMYALCIAMIQWFKASSSIQMNYTGITQYSGTLCWHLPGTVMLVLKDVLESGWHSHWITNIILAYLTCMHGGLSLDEAIKTLLIPLAVTQYGRKWTCSAWSAWMC